jgi:hypothetical protein
MVSMSKNEYDEKVKDIAYDNHILRAAKKAVAPFCPHVIEKNG